jgi:hypothetical protein
LILIEREAWLAPANPLRQKLQRIPTVFRFERRKVDKNLFDGVTGSQACQGEA